MKRRSLVATGLAVTIISIAGCATNTPANGLNSSENAQKKEPISYTSPYAGRISLVIDAAAGSSDTASSAAAAQSFSGSFEIRGNADIGEMDLLTPLGQIVMRLRWRPDIAVIFRGNQRQLFASGQELLQQATGASITLPQLFDWLQGKSGAASSSAQEGDWQVDLAGYDKGRIIARRSAPTPAVLRIALELP